MNLAFIKDTLREIRHSLSRFLSVLAIVALGVSFFAGVKATCPDMKITADQYFDDYRLMDIRVVSTMGLTDKDVEEIKKIPGFGGVYPTCNIDSLVNIQNKDLVVRVISLPPAGLQNTPNENYINRPKLIQGRWPQKNNECVTEKGKILDSGLEIGSKLTLSSGTDKDIGETLENREFTITGLVETPYYIAFDRGISNIGSGKINTFIMIPGQNFKLGVYTDIFLTVRDTLPLMCYDEAYDDTIKPYKTALENMRGIREEARYREVVDEANGKLNDSKKELADAEATQKKELADAMQKINDAQKEIDEGEKKLTDNEARFNREIKKAKSALNKGYDKLKAGEKEYTGQKAAFEAAKKQAQAAFPAAEKQISDALAGIAAQEAALNNLKAMLANPALTEEQKQTLTAQIAAGEQALNAAKAQAKSAQDALDAQKKQLSDAEKTLQQTRAMLDSSKADLDKNKRLIAGKEHSARKKIDDARQELNDAKAELADGRKEYNDKKSESDLEIADAHQKINDAEKDIRDIKRPEWHVLGRDTNPGFVEYGKAADRMDAIALVFPVFFILVTALVCLTTMTRMIDEQRTYIGMLKALGFSKSAIAARYLFYASAASVSGSVIGAILGFQIFPSVISNAYAIMYTLPPVIRAFNTPLALISIIFAVFTTTLTAWAACYKELKATPATLMRPKAPRPGKRVFLEKIHFIWSRLNFTQKITMRNIFRYKKRFLMTIFGIAGCSALVLSGFGLRDSISSIATKQYDEIFKYNMLVMLSDKGEQHPEDVKNKLDPDKRITQYMFIREQPVTVNPGDKEKEASLYVPEDYTKLSDFILLRERTTGKKVGFMEDGVIITEKLAAKLNLYPGGTITIQDADKQNVQAVVSGIAENYVAHYIYMPSSLYRKLYGKPPVYNEISAKTEEHTEAFEDSLSTGLIGEDTINAVNFSSYISRNFNDIIASLYYVVLVLIVSAGGLAIIVLYNLTNINITERLREIATIKVLGFYDNEVSAYVYRENILLTVFGVALGIVMGIFLHQFVVTTAEVDYVMFGREIAPLSYLYCILLTALFTGIVNFTTFFRLRSINMVESLKSLD